MNKNSILKEFLTYIFLNVIGMLGISLYILADTFFISRGIGAAGLAALNIALPVYNIVNGCGLMLSMGGATKYSIAQSTDEHEQANAVFSNTVVFALILSIIFIFTGIFFSKEIATALGADAEVFDMTNTYLKIILLFSPAFILNNIFICFVRNDNNPNLSTIAMLFGSIFNIIFDYIFIFPLKMGIFGAVLATGFSPVLSMLILLTHKIKAKNRFHFAKYKPSLKLTAISASLGFPSLVSELSSGIVLIVFNLIIFRLQGNIGIAAYGVIANISMVLLAIYTGIAQGVQPLVSISHGRGDRKSIHQLLLYSLALTAILSAVIYAFIFWGADIITSVFNSENNLQLQQIAISGLKYYFTASLFVGFNIVISVFFTSAENPLPAHILSLLRGFIVIIPMAFLLSSLWNITGVWLAFPATEALVALLGIFIYRKYTNV